jgi:DNA-directed RNA polymerase subunit RPC12/RpoP
MTINKAIDIIKCLAWHTRPSEEDVEQVIKALEQQPCEDAISRQEAIKYLNTNMAWYDEDGEIADSDEKLKAITDLVNGVPPVIPQPKTGHWINIDETHSKCDRCGAVFEIASENGEANYCPNCGAKMVEPQESENVVVTHKNLCDSCITKGCIFQSGIVRNHCDFYKAKSEEING